MASIRCRRRPRTSPTNIRSLAPTRTRSRCARKSGLRRPRRRGRSIEEIVAVEIKDRKGNVNRVETDEHPRADTTLEALAKLGGIVRDGGSVTAGNASGVNDGAAALIIASGQAAEAHGLTPIARILGYATAGVAPRVMGVGPIPAVGKLTERLKLKPTSFEVVELNEAFASQALACLRGLGLADDCGPCQSERRSDRARPSAGHVGGASRRRRSARAQAARRPLRACHDVRWRRPGGGAGARTRLTRYRGWRAQRLAWKSRGKGRMDSWPRQIMPRYAR